MRAYSKETLNDLKRSGLDGSDAHTMGIRELTHKHVRARTKNHLLNTSGYSIPYFDDSGQKLDYWRIRFHEEQPDKEGKPYRYTQTKGSMPELYLPPNMDWTADINTLCITEGEKKAFKACKEGIPCMALGGVYSFQSKKRNVKLLPYLGQIARKVKIEIAFDADFRTNPEVRRAAHRLAHQMRMAGCKSVTFVVLPDKMKLDDYLCQHSAKEFGKLPREEYTVRDQCEAVRALPKLRPRERHQMIFKIVTDDMRRWWAGHRVKMGDTEALYIFDKRASRLYPFDNAKDGELIARLNYLYGINGSEPEWSWLHDELSSHYRRTATPSQIFELSAAGKSKLYIYNGDHGMLRVTASGRCETKPNGYAGKLFRYPAMEKVDVADTADASAMQLLVKAPHLKAAGSYKCKHMRLLLECWIWSMFFPHLMPTRPLLLLYGPRGSRKTSTGLRIKQSIFGASQTVSSVEPDKPRDVAAALMNDYLVVLDNLDGAHKGVENLLAVAATGGEHVERKLYANGQKHSQPLDSFVIATSRDPQPFRRDDVVNRLLLLNLDCADQFVAESVIRKQTAENRPRFWRYVLDTLPKILRELEQPTARPSEYRLADFANFCFAVAPAIGRTEEEVREALAAHEGHKDGFELETSSLPGALSSALKKGPIKSVKAKQLLDALREADPDFQYRSPVSLGKAIQHAKRGLLKYEIEVISEPNRKGVMEYTVRVKK